MTYDEPRGVIIGSFDVSWRLFYDGREQGQKQYSDTQEEAEQAARAAIAELEREWQPFHLYTKPSLWEIRIWA